MSPILMGFLKEIEKWNVAGFVDMAEEEKPKKKVQTNTKARGRSAKYKTAVAQVEKSKQYAIADALELVEKTHIAKFDETVELHINTTGSLNGSLTLPHGTGKSTRVAILNPNKDAAGAEALLKDIESGKINFDVCITTPDMMATIGQVARVLGPKGLMPNPKLGTVTQDITSAVKNAKGGQVEFRVEKAGIIHVGVGKLSFSASDLSSNVKTLISAVVKAKPAGAKGNYVKGVYLSSTMGPSVKLDMASVA